MYDLGVRISTLTWNFPNELGFPNPAQEEGKPYLPDLENGLTPTGITFVEEMERLGIVIDLSHLNDAGIRDVLHIREVRSLHPIPMRAVRASICETFQMK